MKTPRVFRLEALHPSIHHPGGARSPRQLSRGLNPGGNLFRFVRLQDGSSTLAGSDANRIVNVEDEDLSVAHLTGTGVLENHIGDDRDLRVVDHTFDLELRTQVDHQFRATVRLGDALLSSGTLDVG